MESGIKECCETFREIVKILDNPRKKKIIETLYHDKWGIRKEFTFYELKEKNGISTGSLHHHLEELWKTGFIYKTTGRPIKYGLTELISSLKGMALKYRT